MMSFKQKGGHSQLSLSGAKGELVAGCGSQQAGGDFAGTGFLTGHSSTKACLLMY